MAKFDDKVNGNTVDADEYNNIVRAFKNTIEDSGQTIDATNTQMSEAIANYVGSGSFYTDSGAANAYVVSPIGSLKSPESYQDGMEVRFRAGNASTTASTINVNSLGVKNIKLADGTTDITTEISATVDTLLRFDSANDAFIFTPTTVEKASQAEVDAGTNDSKFITPAKLLGLFEASSQAADGYIRLPINISGSFGEIIIQWGVENLDSTSGQTITFPIAFPNSCLWATGLRVTNQDAESNLSYTGKTTTQITGINPSGSGDYTWIAIGY